MPRRSNSVLLRSRSSRLMRHCSCGLVLATSRIDADRIDALHALDLGPLEDRGIIMPDGVGRKRVAVGLEAGADMRALPEYEPPRRFEPRR